MKKLMSISILALSLLLLLGVSPAQAQAPDFEGTWEISWETELGEERSFTVDIERQGREVLGTAHLPHGEFAEVVSEGTEEVALMHGDTHGRIMTFKVHPLEPTAELVISLYAAVGDERMEGYMTGVMPNPDSPVPFVGVKRY